MLSVDYSRWGQDPDILRVLGLSAEHPRTRERFLALYEICGDKNATQVGQQTGRNPQTVMAWVHRYNSVGPAALVYQHTGGRPPFYPGPGTGGRAGDSRRLAAGRDPTAATHCTTGAALDPEATAGVAPGPGQGPDGCCRETIRQALKRLGLSWKKARKLLNKADPHQRAAFLEKLKPLLIAATRGQHTLVYIDEAHFRQDTDAGYGWSIQGERFWVSSSSPKLGAKLSCYGVYFYNQGRVELYPYERANSQTTVEVLETLRRQVLQTPLTVLWDGASYHRAHAVTQRADELQIRLLPLSAYRPDFMAVEHLWQWIREDVTYHTCYDSRAELIAQLEQFQQDINATPYAVADRLWVKTDLDPEEEKLRVSK